MVTGFFQDDKHTKFLPQEDLVYLDYDHDTEQFYDKFTLINWQNQILNNRVNNSSPNPQQYLGIYQDQGMFSKWLTVSSNITSHHGLPISYNLATTGKYYNYI